MKKFLCIAFFFLIFNTVVFSEDIVTASDFFNSVSEKYAEIKDYEAEIDIEIGKDKMAGKVSFKRPEMLRIDFTNPAEQVIVFNGTDLTIYLPGSSAILEQNVEGSGLNIASSQGLALLRRYYSISYEQGQTPVPLDEENSEPVVKLLLSRRSASEAFKTIILSIGDDKLIRRVQAVTAQDISYVFDFQDYVINTGLSDQRFIYDPPSSANNYNNFLLSE